MFGWLCHVVSAPGSAAIVWPALAALALSRAVAALPKSGESAGFPKSGESVELSDELEVEVESLPVAGFVGEAEFPALEPEPNPEGVVLLGVVPLVDEVEGDVLDGTDELVVGVDGVAGGAVVGVDVPRGGVVGVCATESLSPPMLNAIVTMSTTTTIAAAPPPTPMRTQFGPPLLVDCAVAWADGIGRAASGSCAASGSPPSGTPSSESGSTCIRSRGPASAAGT